MGVTFTTRSHQTNRKNEVLKVLLSRPFSILVGWDILDSELVSLGFSHLGGISSKLVDEIAASDHFKSTSSFSLSDCTIGGSLDELEFDAWSGRSVLPGWDTPWHLESNVVSTFSHGTSGSWKSEIDSDGSRGSHGSVLDDNARNSDWKDTTPSTRSTISGLTPFIDLIVGA